MTELYKDIPQKTRDNIQEVFNLIQSMTNPLTQIKLIESYRALLTPYEQEYFDLTFAVLMEKLKS